MRSPLLAGVFVGILLGAVALAVVVASLRPLTLEPLRPTAASPAVAMSPSAGVAGGSPTASPAPSVGAHPGDLAPALSVPQLGGGRLDLASLRGRPVWVAFTASWCPSCLDDLATIAKVNAQLGSGLVILVIDVKESEDTVATLVAQASVGVPVGLDGDGAVAGAWSATVLPTGFFVDADGVIRYVVYGEAGPPQILDGIHSVLPAASPSL